MMGGPQHLHVVQAASGTPTYLVLTCAFTFLIWVKCASLFHLPLDMSMVDDVWPRMGDTWGRYVLHFHHACFYLLKYLQIEEQ